MRKGLRRKYHKEAVKLMREINRQLKEDHRIGGRFILMENAEEFELFPDGSGGVLRAIIRCYDRMHDEYKDYWWEFAPYYNTNEWSLTMEILNDFACKQMMNYRDEMITKEFKDEVNISEVNHRPAQMFWGVLIWLNIMKKNLNH